MSTNAMLEKLLTRCLDVRLQRMDNGRYCLTTERRRPLTVTGRVLVDYYDDTPKKVLRRALANEAGQ